MADLPKRARERIGQAIDEGAAEIVAMQKRLVPKRTGALANSIVATKGGGKIAYSQGIGGGQGGDPDLTVRISAGNSAVRYAHLVEFGTAPHENAGKFAGSDHPGSRARPFFYPPYRALRRRVRSRISRAAKKAAQEIAAS